ncbi:hypothetical protein CKK33_17215 [Mucilaginibacter sp. MD40]|uniref:helix-turn-helix domain-containing protein n=1 Tax=Mucilaginibacter sp. MD40 TaxID=2029590 RepID=UPI000BAC4DDD|nr:AraC family transcriptional regulator [Mucilaginibacter sp. MD40]PAW95143.1 hypothetical protein CKK33_17215 [Mucilaginibacter sp. MD40]
MNATYLHIKNMCCQRCIEIIRRLSKSVKLSVISIKLGELVLKGKVSSEDKDDFEKKINQEGFYLSETHQEKVIGHLKTLLLQYRDELMKNEKPIKLSEFIVGHMQMSFSHLSRIFSKSEGVTIERYLLLLRLEKAKELLIQKQLSVTEVSYKLGYNSPQSFITQFRKDVGKTPHEYQLSPLPPRNNIDALTNQYIKQQEHPGEQ